MITIYQCENSTDGIFTGVYDAWASGLGHGNVKLQVRGERNLELFSAYVQVETDGEKAAKVARTLKRRLSQEDFEHICQATLSKDPEKADSIYRVIVLGLSGRGRDVMQNLQEPHVCRVFEMSRNAGHEAHQYTGFVRFRELDNGVLFSEIHPDNAVLPLIGDHFANRFPQEHFLIFDSRHEVFLVHEAGKQWALVEGESLNREAVCSLSDREEEFQKLWKTFCTTIAIRERVNPKLQRSMLPLRYRVYMTENFA